MNPYITYFPKYSKWVKHPVKPAAECLSWDDGYSIYVYLPCAGQPEKSTLKHGDLFIFQRLGNIRMNFATKDFVSR